MKRQLWMNNMKKSIVYFLLTSVLMLSCIFTVSMNKCYANQITINEEYGAEVMQDKFVALWPDAVKKNMNSLYGVLLDSQYKSFIAFQPASNGYVQEIYVATDNGLNISIDNGISWITYKKENGIADNKVIDLSINKKDGTVWITSGNSGLSYNE